MTFYKNTEVIVLEASASLSKVRLVGQEDYQAVWVPNRLLEQRNGTSTTLGLVPPVTPKQVTVEQALVPFVKRLRILHSPRAAESLKQQAEKLGITLDPRTRPLTVTKGNGMRSAAAVIEFDKSTPTNLLPAGYKTKANGRYSINSLTVAFALLKAGAKQTAFA
jgi:hypothetical protein